jgi:signal transduction histidine kinase/ActR/RegA family two-component response regulator
LHIDCRVSDYEPPQLGRLIVPPLVTMGVLAAVLVWEVEHVGSVVLAVIIAGMAISVGTIVARRLRRNIDDLASYYEGLLHIADEQSRQAESANRLKDEFLATLSHELRTPLNSVLGWSRLLASRKLDAVQTTRAIQAIERAGWAQSRLIEDLLDLSRIVAGKLQIEPRPTAIQPLIEAAVDSLRPAADAKHLTIDLHLDQAVGPVAVDPDRIQQVAWNLLSNSIKFTHDGGWVEVSLKGEAGDLVLSVLDTGVGFRPEIAAHLFERFRQGDSSTTRQFGGLGLGLGIVRHIAELHGGTVTASSGGADAGSVFTVRIPIRLVQNAAVEMPLPANESPPSLRGVSVLVVDDDPHALDFVRTTLERSGAVVATAASAKEGRDRFTREPADVIVRGLIMEEEDGFDFIREIRQLDDRQGRRTPAAALSALARADDRRRALSAGYQVHVAKPIDPAELVSTVEHLAHHEPAMSMSDG